MGLLPRFLRELLRPISACRNPAYSDTVDEASARAQVASILLSPDFIKSSRLSALLAYIAEKRLAGRGSELKAFSIAIDVFHRSETFDPQTNPLVRIEIGHLRRALERYYLTRGVHDRVTITIPMGSYIPVFARSGPSPPVPRIRLRIAALIGAGVIVAATTALIALHPLKQPGGLDLPRLVVKPFLDISHTPGSNDVARGLSEELMNEIA